MGSHFLLPKCGDSKLVNSSKGDDWRVGLLIRIPSDDRGVKNGATRMNHTDIDSKIDWAAFYEQRLGRAIVSRSGDEWTVRCPLHKGGEEKHPSLSVNVKNSLWHCHG